MPSLDYLAIVLGSMIVVSRLPGIFYPKDFAKFLKSVLKETMMLRMFSMIILIFSVSILLQKYDFTKDWETVMSVLGWLMLLAALHFAWCPDCWNGKVEKILKSEGWVAFLCFIGTGIGAGLMYLGFYVY
jgi:hypothetical protein